MIMLVLGFFLSLVIYQLPAHIVPGVVVSLVTCTHSFRFGMAGLYNNSAIIRIFSNVLSTLPIALSLQASRDSAFGLTELR